MHNAFDIETSLLNTKRNIIAKAENERAVSGRHCGSVREDDHETSCGLICRWNILEIDCILMSVIYRTPMMIMEIKT